jgi:CTP synthase
VALVGKYVQLSDAYLSVIEALGHAAIAISGKLNVRWISAEELEEKGAETCLKGIHALY